MGLAANSLAPQFTGLANNSPAPNSTDLPAIPNAPNSMDLPAPCIKLAHLMKPCSHGGMRKRGWTWFLSFTKLLACLAVVTSLWGCATPYEIIPTASGLPTSAQVEADKRRYAIPPDLRARLDEVMAKSGALAENSGAHRPFVGQMLDPRAMLQRDLLAAVLEWAGEKPSDERLTLQTRQMQAVPRYEVVAPDVAAEDPSTLHDPKLDFGAGAAAGAAIAGVPLGPFAADVAIELKVLPNGTYWGRVGRTCGEFVSGVVQMGIGCAGISGGVGASGTGGGSIVGIPLVAASYALALNGASSAAHAMSEAGRLWREGPPPDVAPAPQPEIRLLQKSKPAKPAPAPPAAPAKPAAATQPAKPAAPVETQTKTFDRSTGVTETKTASGTTTVTKPRVKGKPSGDAAKDVAKGEPPQLARGKRAHKEEPVLPGEKMEAPTPSGKRMDRYNPDTGHIREIKSNNPRQVKAGEKQVEQYRQEMENATGRPHTGEVSTYDPKNY